MRIHINSFLLIIIISATTMEQQKLNDEKENEQSDHLEFDEIEANFGLFLNNNDNLFLVEDNEEVEVDKRDQNSGYYIPISKYGLHPCTIRSCNCYIGDCYAYCAWNWCYETQSVENSRYFLPCDFYNNLGKNDEFINPKECKDFLYPCSEFC